MLLVGYSYFDKYYVNPAEEIVRVLDGEVIDGYVVEGVVLLVSVDKAKKELKRLLEEGGASIVVGIGLSPSIEKPVIELAFVNMLYFTKPDIEGKKIMFSEVVPGGPSVLYTRLPVRDIVEECRYVGSGIRPGVSVGTYLCNMAGYMITYYAYRKGFIGGFIHVPPHTDLALRIGLPRHAPLYELVDTIKCVLKTTIKRSAKASGMKTGDSL